MMYYENGQVWGIYNYINNNLDVKEVELEGSLLINFNNVKNKGAFEADMVLFDITRNNLIFSGNCTIKAQDVDYSVGVVAGGIKYYNVFFSTFSNIKFNGIINIDGNNKFSKFIE